MQKLEIFVDEKMIQSIDFLDKIKYNEYTNVDKLIYQIK